MKLLLAGRAFIMREVGKVFVEFLCLGRIGMIIGFIPINRTVFWKLFKKKKRKKVTFILRQIFQHELGIVIELGIEKVIWLGMNFSISSTLCNTCLYPRKKPSHLVNPLSIFFLSKNTADRADEKKILVWILNINS